jgi:hypothetical protein
MKIEISFEKENDDKHDEMGKSKTTTAFQRKVAKLLAKSSGRSKPNKLDMYMAAKYESKSKDTDYED